MKLREYIFIFLFLLLYGPAKCRDKKDPVARFSFNNKSEYDEIGKRKAKLRGVNFAEDRFGNAHHAVYLFGNENSYVNLGNYKALKPKAGSISLWLKIELEVTAGRGGLINPVLITKCADREDYYEAYVIYYLLESDRIEAGCSRDSLKQVTIYSMEKFSRLQWHHLVLTYDNNFVTFYIDGKKEAQVLKNYETQFNPLDSVLLGTTASIKNARYLNGIIDDVEFYDRVITDDEVMELYQAPNPNSGRLLLNWVLLGLGFATAIVFIYFFIRYRLGLTLKKEKQRLELYNIVLQTELRVNRALMNPHFVFNSLNALQNFILKNENEQANNYLVKFSKLIRRILESNMSDAISLEFEILLLKAYLEIEDLRFEENIKYSITLEPRIIPSAIQIPVMMLQPFVENAIWHGLLKKEGEKILNISFSIVEDTYVFCIIDDNGLGRNQDKIADPGKDSLATEFIRQRINLLNRIHDLHCSLTIEDKPDRGGTRIKILLPILKNET